MAIILAILLALFSRDVVLRPTVQLVRLPSNKPYICTHISGDTDNLHQTLIIMTIISAFRVFENFVWINTVVSISLICYVAKVSIFLIWGKKSRTW